MKKSTVIQIFIFILAAVFLGIGGYLFQETHRNIFTAIFLRAGAIFFLVGCFWQQILRLPRWTDIGWLPLAAAAISWRPFLLKFAIPISLVLIFLNSPIARGKYKPKSWRHLREGAAKPAHARPKTSQTPQTSQTSQSSQACQTAEASKVSRDSEVSEVSRNAHSEKAEACPKENVIEVKAEKVTKTAAETLGTANETAETAETAETLKEVPKTEAETAETAKEAPRTDTETAGTVKEAPRTEAERAGTTEKSSEKQTEKAAGKTTEKTSSKTSSGKSNSDVRGPNAKNVMFRAFSRVAGRQVGKMMNSSKKK